MAIIDGVQARNYAQIVPATTIAEETGYESWQNSKSETKHLCLMLSLQVMGY